MCIFSRHINLFTNSHKHMRHVVVNPNPMFVYMFADSKSKRETAL
jgi:hypothetical protein